MNRISHFLRAKTQYNLHSPFVYRLYTEVLFSHARGRGQNFEDVVWRIEEYYDLPHSGCPTLHTPDGTFFVVADTDSSEWAAIVAGADWQVTLDLYHCGVAVASPRLSKQHFLLR